MTITTFKTPHFNSRAKGSEINTIIIHHTAMYSVESVLSWFKNPVSKVSSHYVIDKNGDVYLLVDEDKKAWHAGVSHWRGVDNINNTSIGIELVNTGYEPFDQAQTDALIDLCTTLKSKYNMPDRNIIGHSDVAPNRKIDPSHHFDWEKLHKANLGIMSKVAMDEPKTIYRYGDEMGAIGKWKSKFSDFGYKINNTDDRYDVEFDYVVKAFKRHYCQQTYGEEGFDELVAARLDDLLEAYYE